MTSLPKAYEQKESVNPVDILNQKSEEQSPDEQESQMINL
jgi:hypothetical protein